jgi:uncharacterized protein (TIGR00266 family)
MDIEVDYRPAYALAKAKLEPNEEIRVEAGAMVAATSGVNIETRAEGGILSSLSRRILGGESFFINTYRAPAEGGQVYLAPALPGDIVVLDLQGEELMVQSGGFLAASPGIDIDTKWGGAKTFFASEGLILLRLSGIGKLVISSYGAIDEFDLTPGETLTVDTGHLVSFSSGMGFKVRTVGGVKSTFFSGEGLVVDLTGPGKATLQTRSEDALLSWLIPKLPKSNDR